MWGIFNRTMDERIDTLTLEICKNDEYRKINEKIKLYYREIEVYLPASKKDLTIEVDDCFTELLYLFSIYFYKNGIKDYKRSKGIFRIFKILSIKIKQYLDSNKGFDNN